MTGVVYYTTGNIDPRYRSQCDNIHLLLMATVPIIKKYGIDILLEPFMNDLEYLEQVSDPIYCFLAYYLLLIIVQSK